MDTRVEGFDVNHMTKWKLSIWGPPEAAIYRKGFVVIFKKRYGEENVENRGVCCSQSTMATIIPTLYLALGTREGRHLSITSQLSQVPPGKLLKSRFWFRRSGVGPESPGF